MCDWLHEERRDANLREEAKEKWAGPLGEKLRGLSNGLLPVTAHTETTQCKKKTHTVSDRVGFVPPLVFDVFHKIFYVQVVQVRKADDRLLSSKTENCSKRHI